MKTVVDKANTRGYANHGWLKTHHTFSFANYYNPKRVHFGMLRVLNDDSVAPGEGFDTHPHKNMEVISIPLKGYLRHGDSIRNSEVITPGDIQVMSAGTGIFHSEFNDSGEEQLDFLQIWVFHLSGKMRIDGARMDLEGIFDDCHDRCHCGKSKYDTKQKQNDILWL